MVIFDISTERNVNVTVTEKVYQGDNKISQFHTNLPSVIGDEKHDVSTCTCEMRCYILDDDYISYNIPTASLSYKTDITIDITEKAQNVPVMFIFEKDGVIVAKTKKVSFSVSAAPPKDRNPLTPRDQFDRIINEQRETIAEQAETITEQAGTITEQGEQITALSGEVTELTTENTRLEALTETQRETIQNMLDNPPQPQLYTPPVITPSGSVQQISPPAGYDGFANTVVDRVSAAVDPDIVPENIREGVDILGVEGTYNPFPEHSVGGIYITEIDDDGYATKYVFRNLTDVSSPFIFTYVRSVYVKEVIFENCPAITSFKDDTGAWQFNGMRGLRTVRLPENLQTMKAYMFGNCVNLKTITIPASLKYFQNPETVFSNCTNLEFVTLENGFNCSIYLSASTRYSAETIVSCLEALADRTGQTAYTITFGTTNLNKLTAEQKAIATNKNWNLA